MKKSFIFFSLFFSVFLLLIFQSSFCWASTDFQIDFSVMGHDLVVSLDNTDGGFTDYKYCIIGYNGSNYQFLLSTSPFYIDNAGVNTDLYIGFRNTDNTNILVSAGFDSSTTTYTYQFSDLGGQKRPSLDNNTIYSNSVVYTDSSATTGSNISVYRDLYEYGESISFGGIVNTLANSLSYDTIFNDFAVIVPFIGVVTLVGLGAYIINRQLIKSKRMR